MPRARTNALKTKTVKVPEYNLPKDKPRPELGVFAARRKK